MPKQNKLNKLFKEKYPENYKLAKNWIGKPKRYKSVDAMVDDLCKTDKFKLGYYKARCKRLQAKLDDWIYEMAYFTNENIPTPKGVAKFITRNTRKHEKENKIPQPLSREKLIKIIKRAKERRLKNVIKGKAAYSGVEALADAIYKIIRGN